jgi:hypothetical protein
MDAPAAELDEEKDVEAAERDRLDGEEVARECARRLLAEGSLASSDPCAAAPDRAQRLAAAVARCSARCGGRASAFTGDPLVSPARILTGEPEHQLSHLQIDRRPAQLPSRLRPFASNQLAVPTQKSLRCHHQSAALPPREHSGERSEESTIGRPK